MFTKIIVFMIAMVIACDGTTISTGIYSDDYCQYQIYPTPECSSGYLWAPGYYNSAHIWIGPRYTRRTVYVNHYSSPTVIHTTTRTVTPTHTVTRTTRTITTRTR